MTVTVAHLLQGRSLFLRLRDELAKAINADVLSSRMLEEMSLVKAVIQEGVRLAAPPANGAKLITPN